MLRIRLPGPDREGIHTRRPIARTACHADRSGRPEKPLEGGGQEDADGMFVMCDSFATQGEATVNKVSEQGANAELLKIALDRPYPADATALALVEPDKVLGMDPEPSPGRGGITFLNFFRAGRPPCVSRPWPGRRMS